MANAFFSDLLATISERGRSLLRRGDAADGKEDGADLIELCEALLSGRGEATGTATLIPIFAVLPLPDWKRTELPSVPELLVHSGR